MEWLLNARIQKLFLVAIGLKVGASLIGWLGSGPWFKWGFGLVLPLLVMAVYIAVGLKRRDRSVTDEKFADSCYYLGFIFTISSIVFALFDLPSIGTKINDIAVRFGAAMISTVLGLVVRVYLVSFKADMSDAIRSAEDELIQAVNRFREHMSMSVEKLRDFHGKVDVASIETVERVKMQVEKMSKDHAEKLSTFFEDLAQKNQKAFSEALEEVSSSSQRLSSSVDGYTKGMNDNLAGIEQKVAMFATAVSERLKTTTFPDDYFAKHLKEPLEKVSGAVTEVTDVIEDAVEGLGDATKLLTSSLKKMTAKSTSTEESLEAVARVTVQHQAILEAAAGQLTSLKTLTESLGSTRDSVMTVVATLGTTQVAIAGVADKFDRSSSDSESLRSAVTSVIEEIRQSVRTGANVVESVGAASRQGTDLAARLEEYFQANSRAASDAITTLRDGAVEITARLDVLSESGRSSLALASSMGDKAVAAIEKVQGSAEQLNLIGEQLREVSRTVQAQAEATGTLAKLVSTGAFGAASLGVPVVAGGVRAA